MKKNYKKLFVAGIGSAALTISALFGGAAAATAATTATAAVPDPELKTSLVATEIAGSCEVADVQISWGTLERWRSYIGGSIAKGTWEVEGDVTYELPEFVWAKGQGSIEAAPSGDVNKGELQAEGTVFFSGHDDLMRVRIANPAFVFEGSEAVLLLDSEATDTTGEVVVDVKQVPFAKFEVDEVNVEGTNLTVSAQTGELTEEGAEGLGGFYDAEEPVDPLTITGTVDCAGADNGANAGTEQGEDTAAATAEMVTPETDADDKTADDKNADADGAADVEDSESEALTDEQKSEEFPLLPVLVGGGVVVVLAIGAIIYARNRKR